MFLTGLLPIGMYQVWHSYESGLWYARSAAFYELNAVQLLGNLRMIPDTIIIVLGAFPLVCFLLFTFPRLRKAGETAQESN
jgi:nitric oxide reductase subunit B